jgi:hypothetical protein
MYHSLSEEISLNIGSEMSTPTPFQLVTNSVYQLLTLSVCAGFSLILSAVTGYGAYHWNMFVATTLASLSLAISLGSLLEITSAYETSFKYIGASRGIVWSARFSVVSLIVSMFLWWITIFLRLYHGVE